MRIRSSMLKKIARHGSSLQRRRKLAEIEKKAPTFAQIKKLKRKWQNRFKKIDFLISNIQIQKQKSKHPLVH